MGLTSHEFKVLLFGPGLNAAGVSARARFVGNRLHLALVCRSLATPDATLEVAADLLEVRIGGYDGRQWQLNWTDADGAHAAMLQDKAAVLAFTRLAPAALAPQLQAARAGHARLGRRFGLALGLVALVVSLLLAGAALLYMNGDRLSRWAADQISVAQERQLGELAYAQLRSTLILVESGAAATAVNEIGRRLAGDSPYAFQFHVAESAEINAFALPGGHIVVYTGLLKAADDAEEVAGVLAHEISHVSERHSLRNMVHGLGLRAILAVLVGDFSGGVLGDVASQLGELHYSRALESEADRSGLARLQQAGIDRAGMLRFFEKMAARPQQVPEFLSSHPAGIERLADLRAALAARAGAPAGKIEIDWQRLRAGL